MLYSHTRTFYQMKLITLSSLEQLVANPAIPAGNSQTISDYEPGILFAKNSLLTGILHNMTHSDNGHSYSNISLDMVEKIVK